MSDGSSTPPIEFPDYGTGSCINCGFLAFSFNQQLSDSIEVVAEQRAEPNLNGWFHCFVHAAALSREAGLLERGTKEQRWQQVIQAGRNCRSWYAWQPGFDARWHYEDRRMNSLEQSRLANDLKIAELQRASDEAMMKVMDAHRAVAEATRQVAEDHKISFERSDRQNTRYSVAFLVLAAIALILAVVPLAYPDGVDWLVDRAPGASEDTPAPAATPTVGP